MHCKICISYTDILLYILMVKLPSLCKCLPNIVYRL